jgi:hypothetical protein
MRQALNSYIKLRTRYDTVLFYLFFFVIVASILVWRKSIYYIAAVTIVLSVLEANLVRCNHCNEKPVKFWKKFPKVCPNCGKNLVDE